MTELWLLALVALLAFAGGWVVRDVAGVLWNGRRRRQIDFTAAAARGDLFEWEDPWPTR